MKKYYERYINGGCKLVSKPPLKLIIETKNMFIDAYYRITVGEGVIITVLYYC